MSFQSPSLPPEFSSSSRTYGYFTIEIGNLNWLNTSNRLDEIYIQPKFWGEKNQVVSLRARNTGKNSENEYFVHYQIKNKISAFKKYLEDMGRIKLWVKNGEEKVLGVCIVNLLIHLRTVVRERDDSPIEFINEAFPIITNTTKGEATQTIGELEIKIECKFEKNKLNETTNLSEISEVRGKYSGARRKSPNEKADSSFLINEMKSQIPNNENANHSFNNPEQILPKPIQSEIRFHQLDNGKDSDQQKLNYYPSQQTFFPKFDLSPEKLANEGLLIKSELVSKIDKQLENEENKKFKNPDYFLDKKGNSKLDDLLEKGRNLKNKLQKFSGENFTSGIFDEILKENATNDFYAPLERMGRNDGKKFIPEIESLKLQLDEAVYMDEIKKQQEKDTIIKQFDTLQIRIISLLADSTELKDKFKDCMLEVWIPVFQNEQAFKKIRLGIQDEEHNNLFYNQEIDTKVNLNNSNHSYILQESIKFKLIAYPEKLNEHEIASSEFKLENIIDKPKFQSVFHTTLELKTISTIEKSAISNNIKNNKKKPKEKDNKAPIENEDKKVGIENIFGSFKKAGVLKFFLNLKKTEISPEKESFIPSYSEEGIQNLRNYQFLLYIDSIKNLKINETERANIFVRYKILSTNEGIETPVVWNDNNPAFYHKMIFPLLPELFEKMIKTPFILEIWNKSNRDQLLGLVHLNLSPISNVLHDSSLKLNKFPMIIYDDELKIRHLVKKEDQGIIKIILALGNVLQINKYESFLKIERKSDQKISLPIESKKEKNKISLLEIPAEKLISKKIDEDLPFFEKNNKTPDLIKDSSKIYFNNRTLIEIFIAIFFDIQNNSKKISVNLKCFLDLIAKNGGVVEKSFFSNFLGNLEITADEIERVENVLLSADFEKVNGFYFIESYRAFSSLNVALTGRFEEIRKILKNNMSDLEMKLEDKADFGYISKKNLQEIIEEHSNLTKQQKEIFLALFNNSEESVVNLSDIYDYIKNSLYPKKANPDLYNILISEKLRGEFKITDNIIFQLIENETLAEIYNQNKIKLFFQKNNYQLSLWETLCLMEDVRNKIPETGWEALREYLKQFQINNEKLNGDQKINLSCASSDEIENLAYLLNDKNNEMQNLNQASPRKETKVVEEKGINTSNEKKEVEIQNEFLIPNSEEKTHKSYAFKIKCNGLLDLDLDEKGEAAMILRYVFPNEENVIESNILFYNKKEKDYKFVMKSEHTLTMKIKESLNKIISDRQMLKISLFIKKNSEPNEIKIGEALIPMFDLFVGEQNFSVKTDFKSKSENKYPLHSKDHIILGFLSFNLTFKCNSFSLSLSESIQQTTIQKLIPKQGYLIIELKKISNFQVGFDKLDISELSEKNVECLKKRDFQSVLFFNLFSEDEDLGQIFKSFETNRVYGKIGYEINFLKVFELNLNEAIIEYLKEKKGFAELRIYFDKNEYLALGACEFSLLDLLLKGQINSDVELFNSENQAIAALSLNIEIANAAPPKKELKVIKPCALMQLHINEILLDDNRFKSLTFIFNFAGKNYKSKKYELKNNNYLQIRDCFFMLDSSETQKIEILEIKLYEEEKFFGYLNLDLPRLISNSTDHYFGEVLYLTVVSSNCLNNTALKIRIGLKIIGFLFENESMIERSKKIIKEFTPDKLELLDQEEKKSIDKIQEIFNLSKMETTKFLNLFPKCDLSFILKFLCPKIRSDLDYSELEDDKELSNEFNFYDYDNNGFVDFDNAIKIFYIFESIFHALNIDDLAKYIVRSNSLDKNIQILNLDQKFDYLLFINKTKRIDLLAEKQKNYKLIERNTINVQNLIANKYKNTVEEKLPSPEIDRPFEPKAHQRAYFFTKPLMVTVFSANNLSSLNGGSPPNSYICFPKFNLVTEIAYRENSPIWGQSFNLNIKENDKLLQIEIFSRAYNLENTYKISTDKKLEEINIDLESIYRSLEEEFEYSALYPCGREGECFLKIGFKLMEKNNFMEEEMNNFDQHLIKGFHQTLAELKNQEREPTLNFNEEPKIEETHEPIKLEKTINDLDQLKHSLLQILNKSPDNPIVLSPKSKINDINNPFENYLFEKERTLKIKDEESKNILINSEFNPSVQKDTGENFDKNIAHKKMDFSQKPPIGKNNSLKNLKEIEKSLRDDKEMERIAKIMKNKEPLKSQTFYDISSDSDY